MDNIYILIFYNSIRSSLFMAELFHPETLWFAARAYGTYDMRLATLAALAGATLAMGANFAIGYTVSRLHDQWFFFGEAAYVRIQKYCRRYGAFLLFVPPIDNFAAFPPLVAIFLGLFRVPPLMVITLVIAGRMAYYGYYLLH